MRKINTSTELYKFLEKGNYLDTPERRKLGTKLYRKNYLLERKRQYRITCSEHTIICDPRTEKMLKTAAMEHGMKTAPFIRQAAIAYCSKQYIVPRIETIFKVEQQIVYTRTQIERIGREKQGLFRSKTDKIEAILESLESFVRTTLNQPADLEVLVMEAVQNNPAFKERLKQLLA